eukprot:scaffold122959_cov71-Phaeocystis_antarctica.AAC.3
MAPWHTTIVSTADLCGVHRPGRCLTTQWTHVSWSSGLVHLPALLDLLSPKAPFSTTSPSSAAHRTGPTGRSVAETSETVIARSKAWSRARPHTTLPVWSPPAAAMRVPLRSSLPMPLLPPQAQLPPPPLPPCDVAAASEGCDG